MKIEQVLDGSYLATGMGELRPIVAEGGTIGEARSSFYEAACAQYEEARKADKLTLAWVNRGKS